MTNEQLKVAFFNVLSGAALGYPIAWPAVNFTQPSSGIWLEVSFFPNSSIDNGLAYNSQTVKRGIFQVEVFTIKGLGTTALSNAADQIKQAFYKGLTILDNARIVREPFELEIDYDSEKISTVVSIEYSE